MNSFEKCLKEIENEEYLIKLSCEHIFCRKCLRRAWRAKIKVEISPKLSCINEKCDRLASVFQIEEICSKNSLMKLDRKKCETCGNVIIPIKLVCNHEICAKCSKSTIKKNLKNKIIPKCHEDHCNQDFVLNNFYEIGLKKRYIQKYQVLLEEKNALLHHQKKECKICYEIKEKTQFLQLFCEHNDFCQECLLKDFQMKILANQCDLICPMNGCKKEINFYILKNMLTPDLFEKYENLLLNKSLYHEQSRPERLVTCPGINCQKNLFMIWKDASYFTCNQCKKIFCSNELCYGDWEKHKNISCLEFKKKIRQKKDDENEELFKKTKDEKKWINCPKCKINIEKISGCNYIRCESNICQKKTCFCYLCSEILNENDVKSHYINDNFFASCKDDEKKKNSTKEKEEVKIEENYQNKLKFKTKSMEIPCPFCGSYPLEILIDYNNKFGICQNYACLNTIYCLQCGNKLKENELDEHLNLQCQWKDETKKIHCPGCDAKEFETLVNFNNKFGICYSYICVETIYCLQCNEKLEDFELLDHVCEMKGSEADIELKCPACECEDPKNFTIYNKKYFSCEKCRNKTFCMKCKMNFEDEHVYRETHLKKCFKGINCFSYIKKNTVKINLECPYCNKDNCQNFVIGNFFNYCKTCPYYFCRYCKEEIEKNKEKSYDDHWKKCFKNSYPEKYEQEKKKINDDRINKFHNIVFCSICKNKSQQNYTKIKDVFTCKSCDNNMYCIKCKEIIHNVTERQNHVMSCDKK